MKEQVQSAGVRQWFGDDYINMQNEIVESISSIFNDFGNCILSGCSIGVENGSYVINDGYVFLKNSAGTNGKICKVNKTALSGFPIFLAQRKLQYPEVQQYGRQYKDSQVKGIIVEYRADVLFEQPSHDSYIRLVDDNDVNAESTFKYLTSLTPQQILAKLLTVDGIGSELDADTTRGIAFTIHGIGGVGNDVFLAATEGGQNYEIPANGDALLSSIKGFDGTGSLIDADLVDGIHFRINTGKLQFSTNGTTWTTTTMDASAILEALLTVDGTNSGLDADYLRGSIPAQGAEVNTIAMRDSDGALTVTDIIIL
jgi:hypothetical protein